MKPAYPITYVEIGRTYAALRWGGASQGRAGAELGLSPAVLPDLEARFRWRHARRPRDAAHVKAVLRAGGYPALDR
jgi:hypothetical protein